MTDSVETVLLNICLSKSSSCSVKSRLFFENEQLKPYNYTWSRVMTIIIRCKLRNEIVTVNTWKKWSFQQWRKQLLFTLPLLTISHHTVTKQPLKRMFLPPRLSSSHSAAPLVLLFIHQTSCPWLWFLMIVRAARIQHVPSGQFTSAFPLVSMRTQDDSEYRAWNADESRQHYSKNHI